MVNIEILKISFLSDILSKVSSNSKIECIGFYSGFISDISYLRLIGKERVLTSKEAFFKFELTDKQKKTFKNVLEIERMNLISEIDHFCITNNNDCVFQAFDNMDSCIINASSFEKEFIDILNSTYKDLKVKIIYKGQIDNSFFR